MYVLGRNSVVSALLVMSLASEAIAAGGSLPLTEVMALAKPYPNLVTQIRLQLVRANLKADKVVCTANRFGNEWTALGGARSGPYACEIGKRTVVIETQPTFSDKSGSKLKPTEPDLPKKAAKMTERGFKWQWK